VFFWWNDLWQTETWSKKPTSSPNQEVHSPVAFAGPWTSGRFHYLGLRYMASQHALHLQVLAGCMCWKSHPPTGKHFMQVEVWFWYVFVVAFASLFDESSHQGNQTRRKTHDVSPKVQTCKPESSLTKKAHGNTLEASARRSVDIRIFMVLIFCFLSHFLELEKNSPAIHVSTENMEALRILRGSTFEEELRNLSW